MQGHYRAFTDGHIVVHHQRFQMGKIKIMLFLVMAQLFFLGNPQLYIHYEFRADSLYGAHGNLPVHHIHDIFRNGKPQPCASVKGGGSCGFLGKGFKYMRDKIIAHPHSRIIDNKTEHGVVFCFPALGCGKGHLTALAGKFDGIV